MFWRILGGTFKLGWKAFTGILTAMGFLITSLEELGAYDFPEDDLSKYNGDREAARLNGDYWA